MAGERTIKIKIGGDAKGLRRAAEQGEQAMSKWSKGVAKMGDQAGKAALIAGAAVAATIAAGIGAGLDKSKTDALLAASLGASGDQAATLGKAAGALYSRGVVGTMEDATAAIRAAIQNALIPPDAAATEVDKVAAKIANLSTVMEEDADRVSSAVSQMLRTGLAKSADEAFDILQRGTEMGINKSQDLLDTFNEYGTQFRKLGLDGPRALGLMSQAIQAGARDSDVAADALKEFALRAADGSTSSAEGFELLGLSAKRMTDIFAAGGEGAAKGLDTVLDRLRAMEDPTEREAAAVALFGTKAEDLQGALWAMDPSSAVKGLGDLGGAAERAGKTLEESAGAKVESLKRRLQGGIIDGLADVATWVEKNSDLVKALAIALGPLVAIVGTIVVVTKVWTAVQTAFNIVMAMNPVVLIVLGIAALIAILVVAYKKSDKFKAIVDAAFRAIGDAAKWLWEKAIKPAWDGIKVAFDAIGVAAKWLWEKAIKPAWDGIKAAIDVVAAVITWWWQNVVDPVFSTIMQIIRSLAALWWWLAGKVIAPVVEAVKAYLSAMGAVWGWLYDKAIKPAIDGIAAAAMWLWNNAIKPAFDGISAVISWAWDNAIKPTFSKIMDIVGKVRDTFKSAFAKIGGFISGAFHGAMDTAKKAINGMISLINKATGFINNSVIANANKIPGVNFPSIPAIPSLARGGIIPAIQGGRIVRVAEAGQAEAVIPLDRLERMLGGGGPQVIEIPIYIGDEVVRVVRHEIGESNRTLRRRALAGVGAV